MWILSMTGAGKDPESAQGRIREILGRHKGEVRQTRPWGERKLAYPIEREKRGCYVLAYFDAPPGSIGTIEREAQIDEEVLRVLILKNDNPPTEIPEVIAQPAGEGEDGDDKGNDDSGGDDGESE